MALFCLRSRSTPFVGNVYRFMCGSSPRHFSKAPEFVHIQGDNTDGSEFVEGEVLDQLARLEYIRPGEKLDIPYEITVSHSMQDFWQSAFYSYDRVNTSTPFARALGFQDQVLPYSLMLMLTGSMSHIDEAKSHVAWNKSRYHWPGFAGDTFRKNVRVLSLRHTSDQKNTLFTFLCKLENQRGQLVFSSEKTLMFPFLVPPSDVVFERRPQDRSLQDHFVQRAETLEALGNQSLRKLRPGQLILHTMCRPLTQTQTMQLASLMRLTHERHFNRNIFKQDEILVPGGCIMGLMMSATSRDLHEILHEEVQSAALMNPLRPGDMMGAISYIKSVDENLSGDLEVLHIKTLGIKNMDPHRALIGKKLPVSLFQDTLLPKEIEKICSDHCPELSHKIVVQAEREIMRQAPKREVFLL
uniref:MaoC-like domain-containing protein n=1 Tax=Fibrocapsa japonica TaxID=94617 RepID=A0A7S2UZD2_9STRA|mmetsp:Transcript_21783/g.31607  ORF Transcript_21783/g.31607 Transcript_21783/m.31607 type:complete len:413 (+) Transcript_21783:50-1288(+)